MRSGLLVISKAISLASGRLDAGRAWGMAPLYMVCLWDGYCLHGSGIACMALILLMVVRGLPAIWGDADVSLLIELRCEQ